MNLFVTILTQDVRKSSYKLLRIETKKKNKLNKYDHNLYLTNNGKKKKREIV